MTQNEVNSTFLYSGMVQIPVCYGSVAVEFTEEDLLTAENESDQSQKRYTHRRFCYIRDGSDVAQDSFYRWLWQSSSRKRARDGLQGETAEVRSPSSFYSFVHHVDFVVPRSFPQPRRTVYEPPFVVEDKAWGEHMVEIHIYFLDELGVPPTVVLHPCLLKERDRVQGDPAASSTAPVTRTTTSHKPVVSERKDFLCIFHPSRDILRHFQLGNRLLFSDEVQEWKEEFMAEAKKVESESESWRLPMEKDIDEYSQKRLACSLSTLQSMSLSLEREQAATCSNALQNVEKVVEMCSRVRESLTDMKKDMLSD